MKLEVPVKVDIDDVTELIHDLQCLQTYKLGANDTMVLVSLDDVADVFADHIRAKRLDKDTNVPSKSALDHIHNVVRDDAYKRGYEQGKAEKVPAITLEWIGEYLAWLKGIGGYGLSDARAIQSMIIKWKMEHPQSGCGPDSCKIGG